MPLLPFLFTLPRRTTIQVKTHAQMILKKINSGVDVFDILNQDGQEQEQLRNIEPFPADVDSGAMDSDDEDDTSMSGSTSPSPSPSPSPPPLAFKKSFPLDHHIADYSNGANTSNSYNYNYNNYRNSSSNRENLENISPMYSITSNGSLPPLPQSFEAAMRNGSSPITPPQPLSRTRGPVSINKDTWERVRISRSKEASGSLPVSPLRVGDYVDPPIEHDHSIAICNSNRAHSNNRQQPFSKPYVSFDLEDNTQDVESAAHILLELSSCSSPNNHSHSVPSPSSSTFRLTPRPELACTSTESMTLDDGEGSTASSSSLNYYNIVSLPPRFSYVEHSRCPV